jgi:hypothetical protein
MAGEQAELERQYVLLGLKLPARGYYKDIAELREAVDVEKAARAEMSALDAERIALGVEVPPGGFPNATLYKAAIVAKRGAQQQPVGTSFVSDLDTPPTPTPTCPPPSEYVPSLMQCGVQGPFGIPIPRGAPTCPTGYFYMFPNKCMSTPTDPAIGAAKLQADTSAASDKAQKEVDRYTLAFQAAQTQKNQIQSTSELMKKATGLYSGISKDLHYSVNQFDSHLKDLQNRINITNRKTATPSWWPWLDIFLNVMLVLVLLYAIYSLVRRNYYVKPSVAQISYQ